MPIPQKDVDAFLSLKLKAVRKQNGVTFFSNRQSKEITEKMAYSAIFKDKSIPSAYRNAAEKKLILLDAKAKQPQLKLEFKQFKKDNRYPRHANREAKRAFILECKIQSCRDLDGDRITLATHAMNHLALSVFDKPSVSTKILIGLGITALIAGGVTAICLSCGVAAIPALVASSHLAGMVAFAGGSLILSGGLGGIYCIAKAIDDSKNLKQGVEDTFLVRRRERRNAECLTPAGSKFVNTHVRNKRLVLKKVRKHKAVPLIAQPVPDVAEPHLSEFRRM